MLTLTFLPLIMTTTSLCDFIIMCAYLWGLFLLFWAFWKMRRWLKPGRDYYYLPESWKCYFPPPQAKHCTICLLSTWGHKRFLSSSVFITRRWLLNLQKGSLGSYPGPPSYLYHLACEDLLPRWQRGSMWRGDVLSYRASLISRLSSRGLCRGAPSQQDDPSCWPHTPESCLVLTALEASLLPVWENWTKSLLYLWKVSSPPTHFLTVLKFSPLYMVLRIFCYSPMCVGISWEKSFTSLFPLSLIQVGLQLPIIFLID